MRIGLDFDNTIARYDKVFSLEAKSKNMISKKWEGNKKKLKDKILKMKQGEISWQKLQGRVYGPLMKKAELFPGLAQFLFRCNLRGDEIFIISHKTIYGHFDLSKTPLRKVALEWMNIHGFFNKRRFGIPKKNIFFEKTRSSKVKIISSLNLDVFVDDLIEIFLEKKFPKIKKILFSSIKRNELKVINCQSWSEIANEILGPIKKNEYQKLAESILNENIVDLSKIKGRGNSRVYKVKTELDQKYLMKNYPDLFLDSRKRLKNEVKAFQILNNFRLTPAVRAFDEELNIALFEWINGKNLFKIEIKHIKLAIKFLKKLHSLDNPETFKSASEACFSAEQLFSQIDSRLEILEKIDSKKLKKFLNFNFKPLYKDVKKWSKERWPRNNLVKELPRFKQTLSPSDFGFHNSILKKDGNLIFFDFEYFGWDDPVKLIADFLWHPAMNISENLKKKWLEKSLKIFDDTDEIKKRFFAAWPVYGLRWVMILLNEFRNDVWNKKIFIDENVQKFHKKKLNLQIKKTNDFCSFIKSNQMECPYLF